VASKLGLPVFLFQEGNDPDATRTFREIARVTKGAHCRFSSQARPVSWASFYVLLRRTRPVV
jgi:hypothetical protein